MIVSCYIEVFIVLFNNDTGTAALTLLLLGSPESLIGNHSGIGNCYNAWHCFLCNGRYICKICRMPCTGMLYLCTFIGRVAIV